MVCSRYSCETAAQTLEWVNAIVEFLRPFKWLLDAHVVNFFKERLWVSVDKQWMDSLRDESVENLLKIPSGIAQVYWPNSLQEFIFTAKSLTFPREPKPLKMMFPGFDVPSLGSVLAQGMSLKKIHEVEILSAVVSRIANGVGSRTIIDVGAGQGYLAQVLSFQYQLSVIALDASPHHAKVTSKRAERIKKHYARKFRKSEIEKETKILNVPRTVTCRVLSSNALTTLSVVLLRQNNMEEPNDIEKDLETRNLEKSTESFVLAGLHACGDLSVTMLRTFLDCKDVKALVSIGCCYNLLSEECSENSGNQCGFPMSNGIKLSGLKLGKNARDLACQVTTVQLASLLSAEYVDHGNQKLWEDAPTHELNLIPESAERWRSLTTEDALKNFQLHAFRAAFQMVLCNYYPEIIMTSPSIGRQGKALRRRQSRKNLHSQLDSKNSLGVAPDEGSEKEQGSLISVVQEEAHGQCNNMELTDDLYRCTSRYAQSTDGNLNSTTRRGRRHPFEAFDKYALFEEFSMAGLCRLGLAPPRDMDILEIWKAALPHAEHVGPFWSLRATLGPVLETLLVLDRLLFLQEHGSYVEASMFALFDPLISPRNVAIIAQKNIANEVS